MKIAGWVLLGIAVLLGVVGAAVGLTGISRDDVDCGTAFGGVSSAAYSRDVVVNGVLADCRTAVSNRQSIAWAILAPAAATAVAGVAVFGVESRRSLAL